AFNTSARGVHFRVLGHVPHGNTSAGGVRVQARLKISCPDRPACGAEGGVTAQLRDFNVSAACLHLHTRFVRDPDVKANPEMIGPPELAPPMERHLNEARGFPEV